MEKGKEKKVKKDLVRAKPNKTGEYNWGLLWGIEKSMLDLADLKLKAIIIEEKQSRECPDCGTEMKQTKYHLVCPNPKCRSEI